MNYLLCLFEQGAVWALNLGLNIWLVRAGGGHLYGIYAFWFNVAQVAGSLQFGLTVCHLAPLAPGAGTVPGRLPAERALLASSLALAVSVGVLVAAAVGFNGGQSASMLSGAALLVPSYLCYQYARALAFSRGFVTTATITSVTVFVLTVGGLAVDQAVTPALDANHVLLITGGAYVLAGAIATWFLASELGLSFHHLRLYRTYASVSRWTLLGVVCFEIMNRMPNFAVRGNLGVAALGRMSATQLPARVPSLFVIGLQPALRNDLARSRERGEWTRFSSHCALASVAALLVNLLWAVPIGLAWPSVTNLLFRGQFADDLALGLLWIASQSLGGSSFVAATAFQVCGEFRRIGLADVAGALGTTTGVAILMPLFGIAGAIAAMIIGQACYLLVLLPQWSRLRDTFPVRARETVNASV